MKRLHPISAVGRVLGRALRLGTFGLFAGVILSGPAGLLPAGATLVLAPLAAFLGAAYGAARYYRFTYELADGRLSVNSGVFDRQEREIPLDRIQNVDIERGVLQRLFGLAVVKFETAGGSATEAVLNAISYEEARELQSAVADYRRDSSGDRRRESESTPRESTPETVESEGDETAAERETTESSPTASDATDRASAARPGVPDQRRLYELSTRDLLTLSVLSFRPAAPAVLLFGVPFAQEYAIAALSMTVEILGGPSAVNLSLLPAYSQAELTLVVTVALVQFALAAWVLSAGFTLAEFYGFRLDRVGEDLRYERGLLQRYSGSIPLGKVQTVTVNENALMRQFGFASLAVETAGYAPGSGNQDASNTAIPLDDRETVVRFAEALTNADAPDIERPPRRSRRRYAVRYSLLPLGATVALFLVSELAFSIPYWYLPLALIPLTVLFGHMTWRHRGFDLLDRVFATRSGVLVRKTRLVPYYRVQTIIDTRNVFQRRLSLASVTADTASTASVIGGDATAHDVDDATAEEIHDALRHRLMDELRAMATRERSLELDRIDGRGSGATVEADSAAGAMVSENTTGDVDGDGADGRVDGDDSTESTTDGDAASSGDETRSPGTDPGLEDSSDERDSDGQ